jgi:hypothetical protein
VGGILAFAAVAVLAVTRLEPSAAVEPAADLAIVAPKPDLAINIVDTPDRNAPDLAPAPQPTPDMAKPAKHHHHSDDDDLPTTVFGPGGN